MPESDAALCQVIRRQLERHIVASQDADVVLAHLAGGVSHHLVSVVQGHAIARVGQDFLDLAAHLDQFFFGHVAFGFPLVCEHDRVALTPDA